MKKSQSIQSKLIIPTTLGFALFILAMILSAYMLYSSNVTATANDQMQATSQQVLNNYETYFDSVITVSDNVIGKYSSESKDKATIQKDMTAYFDTVESFKSEILQMSLYSSESGSLLCSDTANASTASGNAILEPWFVSANNNPLINIFSRVNETTQPNVDYSFTLSRHVLYDKDSAYDAVLKVVFDFAKIVDTISPTTLGTGGRFTIYDKNYGVVYTSSSDKLNDEMALVKQLVIGSNNIHFASHDFYLYSATISNTTWRVAIFINRDAVSTAIASFTWQISLTGIVLTGLFIVFTILISRSISNPIRRLQNEMAEIESLNYGANLRTDIKGPREVEELNDSFNAMMGRVQELTKSLVAEKEEQRKSELKALQNQINPHFLYNTLDSIIAMIDKGENAKAEDMIVALSKFFRISISKGQNIIPLANEIEHARNYLLIQKMRFGDAFSYTIDVEPGLEAFYVVKLILQPLVENSIGHGLKEGETGHIDIKVYTENHCIRFDVKDNGYGMTPEKVKELTSSLTDNTVYQGVGLKNVYQRIRIYYGEEANLIISSEEDVGTTISILIPKKGALTHEEAH